MARSFMTEPQDPPGSPDKHDVDAAGDAAADDAALEERERLPLVRAGNEDFSVDAHGTFTQQDAAGYLPTPESELLRISIESFEGPLDLLLFLIEKHALDVLDIPIKVIVLEYLKVLDDMRDLNLDVAGEFLVMAAQLAHIKSRMLLPKEERPADPVAELDPRADLVRRLLEYQRFKDAAARLDELPQLGRDLFARALLPPQYDAAVEEPKDPGLNLADVDPLELIRLLDAILRRQQKTVVHEVLIERIGVGARINDLVDIFCGARDQVAFTFAELVDLFGPRTKRGVIVTFLSVLEMARLRLVHLRQEPGTQSISVVPMHENLRGEDDDDVVLTQKMSSVDEFGGPAAEQEAAS